MKRVKQLKKSEIARLRREIDARPGEDTMTALYRVAQEMEDRILEFGEGGDPNYPDDSWEEYKRLVDLMERVVREK